MNRDGIRALRRRHSWSADFPGAVRMRWPKAKCHRLPCGGYGVFLRWYDAWPVSQAGNASAAWASAWFSVIACVDIKAARRVESKESKP